jgi:SAM-dependent methyltransferase
MSPEYSDIIAAKAAYLQGQNITNFLRARKSEQANTVDIIEFAYDLQAGTDIARLKSCPQQTAAYCSELSDILGQYVKSTDSLLDIGTGEMTTLALVLSKLANKPKEIFAFDLSWSRIAKGAEFFAKSAKFHNNVNVFVADISAIPLNSCSIDIITSSHALEPNGAIINILLKELFRVAKKRLVLFEPCYEINSEEGKRRMEELGYIQNFEGVVVELGGKVVEQIRIENLSNPLNPTVCFVIEAGSGRTEPSKPRYSVPGTDFHLELLDNVYFSRDLGLSFPILRNIPILREKFGIISTALRNGVP